jgi:hypothetical protein
MPNARGSSTLNEVNVSQSLFHWYIEGGMDDPAGAKDVDAALHAAIHNQACGCGPFFLICIRRPYIYIDIDKYIYIYI